MIFVYAAIKYAAYSGWCFVGLRAFGPRGASLPASLGLGLIRLAMGLFFGVLIYFLSSAAMAPLGESQILVYFAVYVPVRWFEWAIIDMLLRPETLSAGNFFLGADGRSRGWRARGIVVSCLADIPVLVSMGGLPVGRFMC